MQCWRQRRRKEGIQHHSGFLIVCMCCRGRRRQRRRRRRKGGRREVVHFGGCCGICVYVCVWSMMEEKNCANNEEAKFNHQAHAHTRIQKARAGPFMSHGVVCPFLLLCTHKVSESEEQRPGELRRVSLKKNNITFFLQAIIQKPFALPPQKKLKRKKGDSSALWGLSLLLFFLSFARHLACSFFVLLLTHKARLKPFYS